MRHLKSAALAIFTIMLLGAGSGANAPAASRPVGRTERLNAFSRPSALSLPVVSDKSLIKLSNNPTVYWLQNNKVYGVFASSLSTMQSNNMAGWGTINTVSSLSGYTPAQDFIGTGSSSNGMLIKLPSNPTVYEIWNGRREALSSNAFSQRGYSFSNVIDVPQAILNMFSPATDAMTYIGQSPVDGTSYAPNTPFTMTWQLQNTGSTTWAGYNAMWIQNPSNGNPSENMTSPLAVGTSVPYARPGDTVNLTVSMISPPGGGTHYMYFQLQSLDGNFFGVQFFIRITVTQPADGVQIVSQSISDNTPPFDSNRVFSATWQLKNTGSTTWNSNYSAMWIQNPVNGNNSNNLTTPLKVSVPLASASPGATVDLSVTLIAPSEPGIYYMYWQLQNGGNVAFGQPFSVKITVNQAGDELYGVDAEGFGTGDSPGSNAGMNDDSLNTASGNFNYQSTDLTVPGRGLDFVFSRSYNSKDTSSGPLGPGWSHSLNIYITVQNSDIVTVHYGDGKVLAFSKTGSNFYQPRSKGYYDSLTNNGDNTWTLLKPDQKEYHFNSLGKLAYIQDRNANRITLNYNSDLTLGSVVDTVGRQFNFSYSGGLLTDLVDPINRHLQFQYPNGRLTVFRDAKNNPNNYSYNLNGQLSEVYDGRGTRIMVNSYDSQGRLVTQLNGRNYQWQFSYDDVNHTTRVTDPNQKQIVYNHDSGFKLLSLTNRMNAQTLVTYDGNNNRQSVTDLNGTSIQFKYSYDGKGNILQSTDPTQNTRQFAYDGKNNPIRATDELSRNTYMGYDSKGNLTTLTDALNRASSITYNANGQPITITDLNQHTTTLTYDPQGNLRTIQDPLTYTTTFSYDAVGRRASVTNERNKTTLYTYDNNDNLTSVQRPIGITTYGYDQADNLTSILDPKQNLTRYEYDANNNLVKETDATGIYFVQHTYDGLDRLVATRDKRGNTTGFEYDNEARLISVTDPMTNRTTFTYDNNGNRLTTTDANNLTTRFTYDTLNRLKSIEDPLHNLTQKDYDAAGHLIRETDARGNATQFTYDEVNNLVKVIDAENGTTEYTYDNNHNLKTQKDANLHVSVLTYDNDDRLISSADPLGNSYGYAYDAVGNRISQTDAKRQTIQFTYDDNDRLTRISYPNSSTVQLSYDPNGNLTQVVDGIGTTGYTYDQLNRISSSTDVYGKMISYQYDANGNIAALIYPDGKQVQYQYDANNRMTSLTDWGGRTVSYQYNNINLLTKITPSASGDNGPTIYTYDLAGQLTSMVNYHTHGSDNTYTYTLDANGNRTVASIQEPLSNRVAVTSQSYTYDIANRIQSAGSTAFSFDANGNMSSKTESGVATSYTYDFNDRLTSDQTNSYFYNGQGVRVAKSRSGATTRYVVDVNRELSQMLCETDGGGNITSYYVYGQGLVYKVLPNGTHYYYQFDPNGSTVSMTTEGDFYVNRYAYDPYGKITNSAEVYPNTNTTVTNPFKFGGRFGLMDEGNGLVYVRARYYSPELGRFLTKDPLTGDTNDSQSLNRYIYAVDNPIRLIDPDGLWAINPIKVITERVKGAAIKAVANKVISGTRNQLTKYINTHGFSRGGEIAFSTYSKLGTGMARGIAENTLGTVVAIGERVVKDWKNPNMTRLEKAARISLTISDTAVAGIAGELGGPWAEAITGSIAEDSFDKRYNGLKKGVDNLFDRYGTTVSWTEYRKNEELQSRLRQQQRQRAATQSRAPAVKVMPRGPAATPIMPRGPKPAPISPRGPN